MRIRLAIIPLILSALCLACSSSVGDGLKELFSRRHSVKLERFDVTQYKNRTDGMGFTEKDSDHVLFLTDYSETRAWIITGGKRLEMTMVKELSMQRPDYMTVKEGAKYTKVYHLNKLTAIADYTLINRWDACDFVRLEYRIDLAISNGTDTQKYILYNTSGG